MVYQCESLCVTDQFQMGHWQLPTLDVHASAWEWQGGAVTVQTDHLESLPTPLTQDAAAVHATALDPVPLPCLCLDELVPHTAQVQCTREAATETLRSADAELLRPMGWVLDQAHDRAGTWRVQAYIGQFGPEKLRATQQLFHAHLHKLYKCPHANHALARLIAESPSRYAVEVCSFFRGRVVRLAKHAYGCRIVERLLENAALSQVEFFLAEIADNAFALAGHRFGNYSVQSLIRHASGELLERCVLNVLQGVVVSTCSLKWEVRVVLREAHQHATAGDSLHDALSPLVSLFQRISSHGA